MIKAVFSSSLASLDSVLFSCPKNNSKFEKQKLYNTELCFLHPINNNKSVPYSTYSDSGSIPVNKQEIKYKLQLILKPSIFNQVTTPS